MKLADLVIAAVPPALAILLQLFPIPSDRYLDNAARERQRRGGLPLEAGDMILGTVKGALSIAAFVPTMMSLILSSMALLYDRDDFAEWLSLWVCLGMVVVVVLTSCLTRFAPFELETTRLRLLFMPRVLLPMTWAQVINWVIYGTNLILVALAVAKFFECLPHLTFFHSSDAR